MPPLCPRGTLTAPLPQVQQGSGEGHQREQEQRCQHHTGDEEGHVQRGRPPLRLHALCGCSRERTKLVMLSHPPPLCHSAPPGRAEAHSPLGGVPLLGITITSDVGVCKPREPAGGQRGGLQPHDPRGGGRWPNPLLVGPKGAVPLQTTPAARDSWQGADLL